MLVTVQVAATALWTNSLTVDLIASDPSELSVPDQVLIPAGEGSVSILVSGVVDGTIDGPQLVEVTASAAGFVAGKSTTEVVDPGHPFPWHNADFPEDVDDRGSAIPTDLALVLQEILVDGSRALVAPDLLLTVPPYVDVFPDNFVGIGDLVLILSFILLAGDGEGESAGQVPAYGPTPARTLAAPTDIADAGRHPADSEAQLLAVDGANDALAALGARATESPATGPLPATSSSLRLRRLWDRALDSLLAEEAAGVDEAELA